MKGMSDQLLSIIITAIQVGWHWTIGIIAQAAGTDPATLSTVKVILWIFPLLFMIGFFLWILWLIFSTILNYIFWFIGGWGRYPYYYFVPIGLPLIAWICALLIVYGKGF